MIAWNDQAWDRYSELVALADCYGSEGFNPWYHFRLRSDPTQFVFLNRETAEERQITLTEEQGRDLMFGGELMAKLPYIVEALK